MQEKLGEHILWHVPVLGPVHGDTIVTTWLVMILALLFFGWVGASYRSAYQTRRQVVVEGVVNYIADLATSTLGPKGEPFVPFFIALFVFIFLLNQFGMIPFKAFGLPFGGSPTADLNTTVPLALLVFFLTWIAGLRMTGSARILAPLQAPSAALSRQLHRRGRTSGDAGGAPVLQYFRRRAAFRHHRFDHRGKGYDRRPEPVARRYRTPVFHSVFQFFRRHRSGIRLHAVGDRLLGALDLR